MLTTLLNIAILHWLALISPGANVLLVSQLAASGQCKGACMAGVGISVVAIMWALMAILGVNALFAAHSLLRIMVQLMGGAYLCFVAIRLWKSGLLANESRAGQVSSIAAFRLGLLTNITNPKTALFFGSVFAAMLPAQPSTPLLAAAVGLVFVNALTWHTILAVALSHPRIQAGYDRQRTRLTRIAASILAIYGVRLLFTSGNELLTQ